jgi:hypothetical protein
MPTAKVNPQIFFYLADLYWTIARRLVLDVVYTAKAKITGENMGKCPYFLTIFPLIFSRRRVLTPHLKHPQFVLKCCLL